MSEANTLWLVYAKANMPLDHEANMNGDDTVYTSVVMPASGKDEAITSATNALLKRRLELFEVKHCEVFDLHNEYSHDPEITKDIRETALLAADKQQPEVGGFVDLEIEEKN